MEKPDCTVRSSQPTRPRECPALRILPRLAYQYKLSSWMATRCTKRQVNEQRLLQHAGEVDERVLSAHLRSLAGFFNIAV
ncbi:hypothetical protein BUPH_08341 (plasmid) [Paraburkholderia phenoliruptrix BR3459a]|uniref:Uncharacterized protein n=1 Tax=Paraburkholderia phenoliruptrix BR3459a TaxID=1229205 RepID=K0DZI3_9BURK|nr:hypothetical protein BUPH_08341 [Paraburkholderia phenoliruptrix BR3459a]